MPVNTGYQSANTTNFSNISTYGDTGVVTSRVSSTNSIVANAVWASDISTSRLSVTGGIVASGVTLDLRTNSVIPSMVTYAGGASISGLTIGQWGFVFNASGLSIAYSSGKTAYFFGGSTLSAAIT